MQTATTISTVEKCECFSSFKLSLYWYLLFLQNSHLCALAVFSFLLCIQNHPPPAPNSKNRQKGKDNEDHGESEPPSTDKAKKKKRGRRPRNPLPLPDNHKDVSAAPAAPQTMQPATPLADCNSALAQLAKDLREQDRRASIARSDIIRATLEKILGELGFLRLYRAARLQKMQEGSTMLSAAGIAALVQTLERAWGGPTSPRNSAADAQSVVHQMLYLINVEDNSKQAASGF